MFKGRRFIARSIASTIAGQLILNVIICFLAFYDVSNFAVTMKITLSGYLLEVLYAILFSYPAFFIILILKRVEGRDAYDVGINYNIFRF